LEVGRCCCSTNLSSTAEHQNPLRSVACRQRNASPLMKGDKMMNVGSTSIRLSNTKAPCVPFACTKRNASPLVKGDKVMNVGWTSVRQIALLLSVGQAARPTYFTVPSRLTTQLYHYSNTPIHQYSPSCFAGRGLVPRWRDGHHSIIPRPVLPAGRFAGRGLVPRWRDGHHSALFVRFPEPCIVIEIQKAHPAGFWRASLHHPIPHPPPLFP
jgi:hypothetical protein